MLFLGDRYINYNMMYVTQTLIYNGNGLSEGMPSNYGNFIKIMLKYSSE